MATLTVATVDNSGIDPTAAAEYVAASAGGDVFANTGREFLFVNNGGGGNITVTIQVNRTVDSIVLPDRTVTVNAGTYKLIGPFATATFNTGAEQVDISYSGVTSVSVLAMQWS